MRNAYRARFNMQCLAHDTFREITHPPIYINTFDNINKFSDIFNK